jgi:glycine hydroxymethyltransferase
VSGETGLIDYDKLTENASLFKPAMIICGGSAYPREWDYARFRQIADDNGALLMMDMAHISGLVATQEAADPFAYCDIVTTTTHKSLRGPRAGMIFFRKDSRGFEKKINNAVFPSLQGGPHEHQIAGIATQLKEVMTPEFKQYVVNVRSNARALAAALMKYGYVMATGGTDNHLVLWDLRPLGLTGSKFEKACDEVCITLNKNSIYGDRSAVTPGGVRIGTPALTTRGFTELHFEKIADLLHRVVLIALDIQKTKNAKLMTEFIPAMKGDPKLAEVRAEVNTFASSFPMPGFDVDGMKYKGFEM